MTEQICGCPPSIPDWDKQDIDLSGKAAHEQKIPTLLFMPLGYEHYAKRQHETLLALGLDEQWLGITLTQTGVLGGRLLRPLKSYHSVSHQVIRLPTPFKLYARLHQGNMSTIKPTLRSLQQTLLDSGKLPKELYICHLTCPRCEAEKGGEQIYLLRRWEHSERLKKRIEKQQKS